MTKRSFTFLWLGLFAAPLMAASLSTKEAQEYIISPVDGATVSNPVKVIFGIKGMQVVPAGVNQPNSGHHHLLIDVTQMPPADKPIPADAQHLHFGKGQTQTTLHLKPGKHTLQLLFGDARHMQHSPVVMSNKITITVR